MSSSKSVQTEQSAALEVEIDEQKQLMKDSEREKEDAKQCTQLLQQKLDVSEARLMEVESQSAILKVEIDEHKELNKQLMTRGRDMKQYIQLLQQEHDKRVSEAVVNAARLREVKSQLAASQPSQPSATPIPEQVAYKSRHSHCYKQVLSQVYLCKNAKTQKQAVLRYNYFRF